MATLPGVSRGNEALFKASMNEETMSKVTKFLKHILHEDGGCRSDKDATVHGPDLAQNTHTSQSSEKIPDPENVKPRGAPRKRMRSFLEQLKKRVIHCGFCHDAGHTIREAYKREHANDV